MASFIRKHKRLFVVPAGAFLLICGIGFVVLYGRQQTLTCVRVELSQIVCTQQVSWLRLFPLGAAQSIEPVQAAATEEHCFTDGETSQYKCLDNGVKLIAPTGELSLSPYFFNTETAQATVDRLNQFIRNPSEEKLVLDNINGIMAVLGLGCVALSFILSGAVVLIFWR